MSSIEDVLNIIQMIFSRYLLPICLFFGIFGNIFNIFIFLAKKFRSNSCSIYFLGTSFTNLFIIIFGIIPSISSSYITDPSLYLTWASCLDQYFFSSVKPYLRRLSNTKFALKMLLIVPICWLIIPIHMLIFMNVQIPYVKCGTSGVYSLVYAIYSFLCSSTPLILMIIFSLLAFSNIRQINHRIVPAMNVTNHIHMKNYDRQIILMLIFTVWIYFISNVLHPTNTLYMYLTTVSKGQPPKSSSRIAIEGFVTYLTWGFFIYINSCSTFYINICVSKIYRMRFVYLLKTTFNYLKNGQIIPEPNTTNHLGISTAMKIIRPN
ncbi:unnamed protein product [Adineta ricciae]|uniref:G-protein coupled receptors family 1 profile domain-containing protein n=1 Tax=Adineta ricciae TaxID=249248 RepID=A0A815HN18_ADIRI|nr:unnamed protein product [Adineta ricciae]